MKVTEYPFRELPFSDLFRTYVSDYSELSSYYCANPFDPEDIASRAEAHSFPGDRDRAVELLKTFNDRFDLHEAAYENISRIGDENALAVVTGQQAGIFGGPLYTVFKTVTTIHLAGLLEQQLDRPVVPVFWLADEDHDYEEIKKVVLLDRDDTATFSLDNPAEGTPPVSEIGIPDDFASFRDRVREALRDTDFSEPLWDLLDECYTADDQFCSAFGNLMGRLFSRHGLVLAGSKDPEIKQLCRECMKRSVRDAGRIRDSIEEQSAAIGERFHRQVKLYDSNLFYLDEEAGRTKIVHDGSEWHTGAGQRWSEEELINRIDRRPERFSPNVFLRPILQDMLLPTLGYVAGPSEVAYYGQMKKMYKVYDVEMPIIFPRMSSTLVEPPIRRIMDELPFSLSDYAERIEDLESAYVENIEQVDVEEIFSRWKKAVEELSEERIDKIREIDSTLEGAAGKATAVFEGELDKLKGKVYRSLKSREETQLNRIHRIKANLYPSGELQERTISFIYFMNKYGVDVWDQLLEAIGREERFNRHKVIDL